MVIVIGCIAAMTWVAQAVARPVPSVQDDRLTTLSLEQLGRRAELIAATGVRWTRVDVFWDKVAPRRPRRPADPRDPRYRWDRLDATFSALASHGIWPLVSVYRSPSWATGGVRDVRRAPNRFQYAAFMVALARRYSGRFVEDGHRLPKVTHFEIWNEPNISLFLRPQWRRVHGRWRPASPDIYARLLKAVTPRLRRARPDALVIAGALAPTNTTRPNSSVGVRDFIQGLARRHPPVMAASQHIYPGAPPGRSRALPTAHGLPEIRALWGRMHRGVGIYVTETGYTTGPTPYHTYEVSWAQQARYLPAQFDSLSQPGVRMVVWYNLQDHALWPSGLVAESGRRKPSWAAFTRYVGRRVALGD
jgi:hypothetical protein